MQFSFASQLWADPRRTALHTHVTVPPEVEELILEVVDGAINGWGSVRVDVRIGDTSWRTSIFPAGLNGAYVVPVKRAVRDAEQLTIGADVKLTIATVDL